MTLEFSLDIERQYDNAFNQLRQEKLKGNSIRSSISVHSWMWQGLKNAVEDDLIELYYTPISPNNAFMATDEKVLEFSKRFNGKPIEKDVCFNDKLTAESYQQDFISQDLYAVPTNKREEFYQMIERKDNPEDIVSFLQQ
jgi:hypothetical protein